MNQFKTTLTCLVLLFSISNLTAQKLPPVHFDFGIQQFEENLTGAESLEDILEIELHNDWSYCWVQFDRLLDLNVKSALSRIGVNVIEYVPSQCYLLELPSDVSIDILRNIGARSIQSMTQPSKIDLRILDDEVPTHALTPKGAVKLQLVAMPGFNVKDREQELKSLGAGHFDYLQDDRHVFFTATKASAIVISELPWVRFIEILARPGEPESVEGMSMQRANLLNNALTGGLRFDGSGIKILVRDDGDVGPHIDFQGRLWNDPDNQRGGTHGDGVAGVFAAAGNLNPTVVAGGSGADIFVIDYEASFLDNTLSLHQDSGVLVTNSSYSNGCNDGYTLSTINVDEQIFENPTLMHVFSAGNSNNSDCGYGAGDQWGNVTGGHKQGKNVITTANLDREGDLVNTSSRGPAHDGRIKPDLSAHGANQISTDPGNQYSPFGGTSAAAPTVASSIAQLYQAYLELNGSIPPSALIKACAMNSAQDLGNPGPDFKFGWGAIHGGRAYEILQNNQFVADEIENSGIQSLQIDVPDGVGELRVMLYWADPPASLNATAALVNDLDLTVDDPNATTLLPYLLDHTPNAISLDAPAGYGEDHLNNVEQVAVTNPAAGSYTVNIAGTAIAEGPQEYFLVYSFIPTGVQLTYPIGNEKLVQEVTERIHWDAFGNTDVFNLEYSIDNGVTWINIASNVDADARSIDWIPPTVISGECLVRITRGAESDMSDETFSIHAVPTNLQLKATALDSALISWSSMDNVDSFTIYQLGEKYMNVIGHTSDTFFELGDLIDRNEYWFSVSANTSHAVGQRALAFGYFHSQYAQCFSCLDYLPLPYLEDFEQDDLGYHCNYRQDSINWSVNEASTPSSATGPSQASGGHRYVYIEASNPNNPGKLASIGGPCLDFSSCDNAYIQFDYHMFGQNMGELNLIVSTDDGASWSNPIWTKIGDQGDQWHREVIDLTAYCGSNFLYQFTGTTGDGFRSDMAIDQIYIDEGTVCYTPDSFFVDSLGETDAFVAWTSSLNGTPYDLELVNVSANMSFTGIPTITNVSDSIHQFTGLIPLDMYEVYMRAQCGGDSSTWIGPLNFVPGCLTVPGNSFDIPIEVATFPYADTNSLDQSCSRSFWEDEARELVYRVETGDAERLTISTCNGISSFDTRIYLLDSNLSIINDNDDADEACVDMGYSDLLSILDETVLPNTTYYVVVAGFDEFDFGEYAVQIDAVVCDSAMHSTLIDTSIVAGSLFLGNPIFNDTTITITIADPAMECDSMIIYNIVTFSSTIDISEGNIRISPNPFDDYFSIESPSQIDALQILNAQGKEIKRIDNVEGSKLQVSLQGFSSGIYFINLVTQQGQYSAKMIKS